MGASRWLPRLEAVSEIWDTGMCFHCGQMSELPRARPGHGQRISLDGMVPRVIFMVVSSLRREQADQGGNP